MANPDDLLNEALRYGQKAADAAHTGKHALAARLLVQCGFYAGLAGGHDPRLVGKAEEYIRLYSREVERALGDSGISGLGRRRRRPRCC